MNAYPEPEAALSGARWITVPGPQADNCTFLARSSFTLEELPEQATLLIAAEARYAAYVNGGYVGSGPARGTHYRYFYDSYEVGGLLVAGRNTLAARVHCPLTGTTGTVPPVLPALIAQLAPFVATAASWEVCIDPAHRPEAPYYTHHIGYSEYRDLRHDPEGWEAGEDRFTGWQGARELCAAGARLGGRVLTARDIPPLTERHFRPARIVATGAVPLHRAGIEEDVDYAGLMQVEMHLGLSHRLFQEVEALTHGGTATILPSPRLTTLAAAEGAYLIADFERAICGHLLLDLEAPAGTIVDVGYDEALSDGRLDPKRFNPTGPIYRFADRFILRAGRQQVASRLHDRGARIVQLTLRRFSEPIRVHGLELVDRVYPLPLQASFRCDQPFLNRLWDKSCATVAACSTDLFIDCPWREQTLWLDDYYEENLYYLCLTAERTFAERNLRVSAEAAFPNGQFPGRYPSARDSVLPVTTANWIMVLSDYYRFTGDLALVRELLPAADAALALFDSWRDTDLLVPDRADQWNFIDWGYDTAGIRLGGKTAVLNMLVAAVCKETAWLHAAAGDGARARHLEERSRATVAALLRALWLPQRRRLLDCTEPGDGRRTFSQIPHALGLYYDLLSGEQRAGALEAFCDPEAVRSELGYQYFVLASLVRAGRGGRALQILREVWGGMVAADTPTLWEVVDGRSSMSGCGSLCHAYACAPLPILQGTVLGVSPLAPGFTEFRFAPQSLGVRWAEGRVPTPTDRWRWPGRSRIRTLRWRPPSWCRRGPPACAATAAPGAGAPQPADRAGGGIMSAEIGRQVRRGYRRRARDRARHCAGVRAGRRPRRGRGRRGRGWTTYRTRGRAAWTSRPVGCCRRVTEGLDRRPVRHRAGRLRAHRHRRVQRRHPRRRRLPGGQRGAVRPHPRHQPQGPVLLRPGGRPAHGGARRGRQDHHHHLGVGRDCRRRRLPLLRRQGRFPDADAVRGPGAGGARHPGQRHRARHHQDADHAVVRDPGCGRLLSPPGPGAALR